MRGSAATALVLTLALALTAATAGRCTRDEDEAYFRVAAAEWRDAPPLAPPLPMLSGRLFCARFVRFWRSKPMRHVREQYGDLCDSRDPIDLFSPTVRGACRCACTTGRGLPREAESPRATHAGS